MYLTYKCIISVQEKYTDCVLSFKMFGIYPPDTRKLNILHTYLAVCPNIYIQVHIYINLRSYSCMHTLAYVYIYICVCSFMYVCMYVGRKVGRYVCMHACKYVCK